MVCKVLENVEKSLHNVPFLHPLECPDGENVGFTISCMECHKPKLVHSKTVVKKVHQKGTKRMVEKIGLRVWVSFVRLCWNWERCRSKVIDEHLRS